MFSYEFVASRKVEDQICSSQRQFIARRSRSPYIFTDFHTKLYTVERLEYLNIRRQFYLMSCITDFAISQVLSRGKPAFLIKLAVVWKISLRYNTENLPMLDNNTTIEQQVARYHRRTYDRDDIEFACEIEQHHHRLLR